jgi:hypothetical protein
LQFELDNYDKKNSALFKPQQIYNSLTWGTEEMQYKYNSTGHERAKSEKNMIKKGIESLKNIMAIKDDEHTEEGEVMATTCFLCDCILKEFEGPFASDSAFHVKCPNCGEYQLPSSLHELLAQHYYSEQNCIMASGRVFETSYYNQLPRLLSKDDFDPSPKITIDRKLYMLAKYIYTETNRGTKEIEHRPACCYQKNDPNYAELLKELKKRDAIDYILAEDDGEDYAGQYLDIKVTLRTRKAFEKSIDSPEKFEAFFMDINQKSGITINYNGPVINSPVQTGDSNTAIITTTTDVTADIIRQKLKENGAPEQLITAVDTEVAEIAAECDKKTPDQSKLQSVLSKIKETGGKFLYDIVTLTISQILAGKISGGGKYE